MTSTLWGPDWIPDRPTISRPALEAPDGIPGTSGIDLRLTREALGLSAQDLADSLGVNIRTVQRWETHGTIALHVAAELDTLVRLTDDWIDRLVHSAETRVRRRGWRLVNQPGGVQQPLPESWWRVVVGRALMRTPALAVTWVEEDNEGAAGG